MGLPTDLEVDGADKKEPKKDRECSFCGKTQREVKAMIAGPLTNSICNECVKLSVNIIREDQDPLFCHDKIELKALKGILEDLAQQIMEGKHG